MSTPDSELDRHLQALFAGLDTRADFDARLMARLRAESPTDASGQDVRARQHERARYRRTVLELQSWRRLMLRLLTLDTLGIAFMLVVAAVTAWPHIGRNVMDIARQYGPCLAILPVVLIAAVPLLGMWAEQSRRRIRVL
jgi:hypothetical protein